MDELTALLERTKAAISGDLSEAQKRQLVKVAFDDFGWDRVRNTLADDLVSGKWPTDPFTPPKTTKKKVAE